LQHAERLAGKIGELESHIEIPSEELTILQRLEDEVAGSSRRSSPASFRGPAPLELLHPAN
jgi:hypothetical protein